MIFFHENNVVMCICAYVHMCIFAGKCAMCLCAYVLICRLFRWPSLEQHPGEGYPDEDSCMCEWLFATWMRRKKKTGNKKCFYQFSEIQTCIHVASWRLALLVTSAVSSILPPRRWFGRWSRAVSRVAWLAPCGTPGPQVLRTSVS